MYSAIKLLPISALLFLITGCYKESDYLKNSSEILDDLSVTFVDSILTADGASKTLITYRFPITANPELTDLLVICSDGKFMESDNDTVKVSFAKLDESKDYRFAEITYVASGNAGNAVIRTEVMEYYRNDTITLEDADVVNLKLIPSTFYIKNDELAELTIAASLSSDGGGIASAGKTVSLTATPEVGFFNANSTSSDGNGNASFTYVFTDTSFSGTITFSAETFNSAGTGITTSAVVEVID